VSSVSVTGSGILLGMTFEKPSFWRWIVVITGLIHNRSLLRRAFEEPLFWRWIVVITGLIHHRGLLRRAFEEP
jgi:hypothetical protein